MLCVSFCSWVFDCVAGYVDNWLAMIQSVLWLVGFRLVVVCSSCKQACGFVLFCCFVLSCFFCFFHYFFFGSCFLVLFKKKLRNKKKRKGVGEKTINDFLCSLRSLSCFSNRPMFSPAHLIVFSPAFHYLLTPLVHCFTSKVPFTPFSFTILMSIILLLFYDVFGRVILLLVLKNYSLPVPSLLDFSLVPNMLEPG